MTRQRLRKTLLVFSAALLPVTLNYFSPYLMTTGAAVGILTASFFVWALWSVTALFVGRAACGWACPLGGIQLLCDKSTHGRRLRRIRGVGIVRYVFWGLWVGSVGVLLLRHAGAVHADLLYFTPRVISVDSAYGLVPLTFMVALAALPALVLGRNAFCRYLCPFAPYNIVASLVGRALRLPQLRLQLSGHACTDCGACAKACPMSLPVPDMVASGDLVRADCVMCGSCADGCKRGVIEYRFVRTAARQGEAEPAVGRSATREHRAA
jgi:ferredoxin-type protein NapH